MRRFVVAAALVTLCAPGAGAVPSKAVRVYVFGRTQTPLDKASQQAREKQAEADFKRLEAARKDVGKALEAKYGKSDRPSEALAEFAQVTQAELMALLAQHEVKVEQKDIDDSVQDVTKALREELKKASSAALVDKAEDADLTVELLARRAKTSFPEAAFVLYLKVTPVGWRNSSRFVTLQGKYPLYGLAGWRKLHGEVTTLHTFSTAEPYWIIEVYQQGSSYRDPASSTAEVLVGLCAGLLRLDGEAP